MGAFDQIRFLMSETDHAKLPSASAEVAFAGRSNCGKSTLLNALCRKELARASSTPGRTRTINAFQAGTALLVDLPGYGFATGPEKSRAGWGAMIEGYMTSRPSLKSVLVLVDADLGPQPLDLEMLHWLRSTDLPARVVATKADRVKPSRALLRRREVAAAAGVTPEALAWVSAKEGTGIKELRLELISLLGLAGR